MFCRQDYIRAYIEALKMTYQIWYINPANSQSQKRTSKKIFLQKHGKFIYLFNFFITDSGKGLKLYNRLVFRTNNTTNKKIRVLVFKP